MASILGSVLPGVTNRDLQTGLLGIPSGTTIPGAISGIGNDLSGGQQANANAAGVGIGSGYGDITPPDAEALQYQLQNLVNAGQLDPQMAAVISTNPSLMQNISTDPALAQAQMSALSQLQNISANNGMDAQAQAALQQAQSNTSNYERGQRLSLLDSAAQRGMSNSNLSFASQLANQQGAAQQLSQAGVQAAADAQSRALSALQGGATLAGNIQAQSFNQQAQQAQAQDAINKFNAQNAQQVGLTNTAAYNAAQAANLNNAQNISNTNVQYANQTAAQQAAAKQQAYANALQLQQQKDAAAQAKANIAMGIGNQNTQLAGALISGGSQIGSAAASSGGGGGGAASAAASGAAAASDINLKKDISPADFDIEDFLSDLTGYKYNYKDPQKYGQGQHISPMAQDLQKSEMGRKMVIPTKDGLMVDYSKLEPGEMLAMFANLNKRIQDLEGAK